MNSKMSFTFKRILTTFMLVFLLLCPAFPAFAADEGEELLAEVVDDAEIVPEDAVSLSGAGETCTVELSSDSVVNGGLRGERIAFVSGGGEYPVCTDVTVTTTRVSGFDFLGWYRDGDLTTRLSESYSYTFILSENIRLLALYQQSVNSCTLNVRCPGLYRLDGVDCWGEASYTLPAGDHTLTYIGSNDFHCWVNSSDKVVSRDREYSFFLFGNKSLSALSSPGALNNCAVVLFKSAFDQVLVSGLYSVDDEIEYPFPPDKMGCTFAGWNKTEEDIKAEMRDSPYIEVSPLYVPNGKSITITVKCNDDNGEVLSVISAAAGENRRISAPERENQSFCCWKNTAGEVLSYNRDLSFRCDSDISLIASYENASGKAAAGITGVSKSASPGRAKISFTMTYDVDKSCAVEEVGFLSSTAAAAELAIGGDRVSQSLSNLRSNSGSFTLNVSAKPGVQIRLRGYVIYKDSDGLHTIYTNIVSETF